MKFDAMTKMFENEDDKCQAGHNVLWLINRSIDFDIQPPPDEDDTRNYFNDYHCSSANDRNENCVFVPKRLIIRLIKLNAIFVNKYFEI